MDNHISAKMRIASLAAYVLDLRDLYLYFTNAISDEKAIRRLCNSDIAPDQPLLLHLHD